MFKLFKCSELEMSCVVISAAVTVTHRQNPFFCECRGGGGGHMSVEASA